MRSRAYKPTTAPTHPPSPPTHSLPVRAWPEAPSPQTTAPSQGAPQSLPRVGSGARASAVAGSGGKAGRHAGRGSRLDQGKVGSYRNLLAHCQASRCSEPGHTRMRKHPQAGTWYGSCLMTSPCASMSAHSCLRAAVKRWGQQEQLLQSAARSQPGALTAGVRHWKPHSRQPERQAAFLQGPITPIHTPTCPLTQPPARQPGRPPRAHLQSGPGRRRAPPCRSGCRRRS